MNTNTQIEILEAELNISEQQIADLMADVNRLGHEKDALTEQNAKLMEALEKAEKDTKRLDWVQSEVITGGMFAIEKFGGAWVKLFTVSTQHMNQKSSIRDAIDAALTPQPENREGKE